MDSDILLLTGFQWIVLILLVCMAFHYMWITWDKQYGCLKSGLKEGFQTQSQLSSTTWFENDELFDDFYSSVYDNLTQLAGRFPQEVTLIVNQWKKTTSLDSMDILDCGCGTGIASILFAKMNVSSVVGVKGNAGQSNYAASKAGIIGFSKSMALELGSRNIRCNVIAPGFIETEMTGALDEKTVQGWRDAIPLKRGGTAQDVANLALFLGSDMSTYITGQTISVCGGMI